MLIRQQQPQKTAQGSHSGSPLVVGTPALNACNLLTTKVVGFIQTIKNLCSQNSQT